MKSAGDELRRIASERVFDARGRGTVTWSRRGRPLLNVVSADDAERRQRRGSTLTTGQMADSTVRTRVHTDKPVRPACTAYTEASAISEGRQVAM